MSHVGPERSSDTSIRRACAEVFMGTSPSIYLTLAVLSSATCVSHAR